MQIWPAKNPDFSWLKVIAYTLYAIGEFYYQAKEPDVLCFNQKLPKILMGILSRPTDERHANSRAKEDFPPALNELSEVTRLKRFGYL